MHTCLAVGGLKQWLGLVCSYLLIWKWLFRNPYRGERGIAIYVTWLFQRNRWRRSCIIQYYCITIIHSIQTRIQPTRITSYRVAWCYGHHHHHYYYYSRHLRHCIHDASSHLGSRDYFLAVFSLLMMLWSTDSILLSPC